MIWCRLQVCRSNTGTVVNRYTPAVPILGQAHVILKIDIYRGGFYPGRVISVT